MSEELNQTVGSAAGRIWAYLAENGEASVTKLAESVGLERNDVQRAIGWLAREGKLSVSRKGKNESFSLS